MLEFLLSPKLVSLLGWILFFGTPLGAAVAWAVWRVRRGDLTGNALFWIIGLSGPLLSVLWRVFNSIEDYFGLDSLIALLLNLVLFAAIGVSLSGIAKWTLRGGAGKKG